MSAPRSRPAAVPLARLAGRLLDPVAARRGFASADLMAAWDDVVGERYAGSTQPEKITWPRGREGGGILTVWVEGPGALFLQHEAELFIERINRFLGFTAIAEIRIVQRPLARRRERVRSSRPLHPSEAAKLERAVDGIADPSLQNALRALGAGLMADRPPPRD